MIVRRSVRTLVLSCVWMVTAAAAPASSLEDDATGPAWLRAPLTRGPVAASFGLDTRHAWWGIDAALPLTLGSARMQTEVPRRPILGLGLSVAGQGGSDMRGLRYSALLDRRTRRMGEWLGLSTGGGAPGLDTPVQLGTGLWRSVAGIEIEAGMVSSFVDMQSREVSRWGFYANRRGMYDTLQWYDTTTVENVNRSGLWQTAQSVARWHTGRLELAAIGGVTVGQHIQPRRWAQAILNLQATRALKLMAALGQRPAPSMAFDPSARAQTMIGVQLAPWATRMPASQRVTGPRALAWGSRSLGDGHTVLSLRCKGAARVELAGDFTDWTPVELTTTGDGRWATRIAIAPGLHQVQIRLDGGPWLVPPGLPTTQGEFAGAAGVLLVE